MLGPACSSRHSCLLQPTLEVVWGISLVKQNEFGRGLVGTSYQSSQASPSASVRIKKRYMPLIPVLD